MPDPDGHLSIVPMTFSEACEFIARFHRHHRPPQGMVFALGCALGGEIVGVATVGRPVARALDDGWTLEVTRTCTDGTKNANSMLYGAAWRAAKGLGYRRLITYTLPEESGASLRACAWRCLGIAGGGSWSRPKRPRVDTHPLQQKIKWEIAAKDEGRKSSVP